MSIPIVKFPDRNRIHSQRVSLSGDSKNFSNKSNRSSAYEFNLSESFSDESSDSVPLIKSGSRESPLLIDISLDDEESTDEGETSTTSTGESETTSSDDMEEIPTESQNWQPHNRRRVADESVQPSFPSETLVRKTRRRRRRTVDDDENERNETEEQRVPLRRPRRRMRRRSTEEMDDENEENGHERKDENQDEKDSSGENDQHENDKTVRIAAPNSPKESQHIMARKNRRRIIGQSMPTTNQAKIRVPAKPMLAIEFPVQPAPEETQIYQIIRKQEIFGKTKYHMVSEDKCLYFGESAEDDLSSMYNLYYKKVCPEGYKGYLRIHEMGKRFTLVTTYQKPHDEREGELLGIYFSNVGNKRQITISSLSTFTVFFPMTRRLNLSRVAKEQLDSPRFHFITAVQSPDDDFGSDLVIKSVKNFKIVDENGNLLYQLYKVSSGQYNIKCNPPFNPFMCFGISIAIIHSK